MSLLINDMGLVEYVFVKIDNTNCFSRGEDFDTFDEAQNQCKHSQQCKGVLDIKCKGQQLVLCLKNATTNNEDTEIPDSEIESCVYEKYAIGKYH